MLLKLAVSIPKRSLANHPHPIKRDETIYVVDKHNSRNDINTFNNVTPHRKNALRHSFNRDAGRAKKIRMNIVYANSTKSMNK